MRVARGSCFRQALLIGLFSGGCRITTVLQGDQGYLPVGLAPRLRFPHPQKENDHDLEEAGLCLGSTLWSMDVEAAAPRRSSASPATGGDVALLPVQMAYAN